MGEMQFTGTQEEWEAFVLLNKHNNMAQHFESLTVYEKMDLLMNISNSIKKDIEKRLVLDNPDLVEMQENRWVYDMIFVLPHHLRIEQLKELLIKFDKEIKYGEQ